MTELCHTGRGLSEEFDDDFQNRLAAYFCRDHEFLTRAGDSGCAKPVLQCGQRHSGEHGVGLLQNV